jgi:hypothetical protein
MADTSNTKPYQYAALGTPDSIRLIDILPGVADSPLKCKLVPVAFSDKPVFEALSYTWGKPEFPNKLEEVTTDVSTLYITNNLCDALRALRSEHESRLLWVDAVCINQKDDVEKAVQVAMMKDVYGKAAKIVVWLGKEHDDPDVAAFGKRGFELLKEIGQNSASYGIEKVFPPFPRTINTQAAYEKFQELARTADGLCLLSVYRHEWFQRVWIVQEFILAKDLDIQYGSCCVSYDIFSKATAVLQLLLRRPSLGPDLARNVKGIQLLSMDKHFSQAWQLISQRERYHGIDATTFPGRTLGDTSNSSNVRSVYAYEDPKIRPSSIIEYSAFAKKLKCSVEVDRIYGMLGFAHDSLDIKPDYESTPSHIWDDLARKTLALGDLTVLHYAGIPATGESRVKSFAADFGNWKSSTLRLGGHGHPRFHSATQIPAKVEIEYGLVRVHAIKVDTVNQVAYVARREETAIDDALENLDLTEEPVDDRDEPSTEAEVDDDANEGAASTAEAPVRKDSVWDIDFSSGSEIIDIGQGVIKQLFEWWMYWLAAYGPRYYNDVTGKWAFPRTIIADNRLPVSREQFSSFDDEMLDLIFTLYLLAEEEKDDTGRVVKWIVDTWKVYEFMKKPIKISLARFHEETEATTYHFPTMSGVPELDDMFHAMLAQGTFEEHAYFDEEFAREDNTFADRLGFSRDPLSSRAKIIEITSPLRDQLVLYKNVISIILSQRHIFFTNCRLLGIGPKGMQAGDVIMVPEGAQTPFVYRRVDDGGDAGPGGYTRYGYLVGECYIHGLMDGDPVEQLQGNYQESHIEVVLV